MLTGAKPPIAAQVDRVSRTKIGASCHVTVLRCNSQTARSTFSARWRLQTERLLPRTQTCRGLAWIGCRGGQHPSADLGLEEGPRPSWRWQSYVVTVPGRGYRLIGAQAKSSANSMAGAHHSLKLSQKPSIALLPFIKPNCSSAGTTRHLTPFKLAEDEKHFS